MDESRRLWGLIRRRSLIMDAAVGYYSFRSLLRAVDYVQTRPLLQRYDGKTQDVCKSLRAEVTEDP